MNPIHHEYQTPIDDDIEGEESFTNLPYCKSKILTYKLEAQIAEKQHHLIFWKCVKIDIPVKIELNFYLCLDESCLSLR